MKTVTSRFIIMIMVVLLSICLVVPAFAVPDDSINSQHVTEADGTSGQDTNSGSGIKTSHIQNGAVTDAKISGPISGEKISSISKSQVTGLDTALAGKSDINHNHDAQYQKKYGKVAVVALSGGDYTNPVNAINDLNMWCGTPTANNPCLLKIMPGVYNIGSSSVIMKDFVDIEGAGENVTIIQGSLNNYNYGTVVGSSNSEIRFLTVKNSVGSTGYAVAVYTDNASLKMTHITALAIAGYSYGVVNSNSTDGVMVDVTAIGTGEHTAYGVYNVNSSPEMRGVVAVANGSATGDRIGVANVSNSSPLMIDVTASGSGGAAGYGVNNAWSSNPEMNNVIATGGGYNYSYGIVSYDSVPSMTNVTATALSSNMVVIGISFTNSGSFTVPAANIERSTIIVGTKSGSAGDTVRINSGNSANIAYTKLDGGSILNYGTIKCIGVYDGNFDPVTCQ